MGAVAAPAAVRTAHAGWCARLQQQLQQQQQQLLLLLLCVCGVACILRTLRRMRTNARPASRRRLSGTLQPAPCFPELEVAIADAIERYGAVFPRLNWSSPQVCERQ